MTDADNVVRLAQLMDEELVVDGSDLTETAKRLAELFAERRRFLFNGSGPVEIVAEAGDMPRAIAVTPEAVRVFAHEICTPVKATKGGGMARTTLSNGIANLYLRGLQGRWGLKPFNGITTSPILASDGSFRTGSGYDEETGLWRHSVPEVYVPEQPTGAQAKNALYALRRLFRTFAFADAETLPDPSLGVDVVSPDAPIGLDESSFLVSLMTAVCRASLTLAPGILATAPAFSGAGTGKGLAMKAICVIASAEELDKRLTAAVNPDGLLSLIEAEIVKIGGTGLSSGERPGREKELRGKLRSLERDEEALVEMALAAGFDVTRRPQAAAEAILGVRYGLAVPVARAS
jgi:hypothetical protein